MRRLLRSALAVALLATPLVVTPAGADALGVITLQGQRTAWASADAMEGGMAFLQKRKPAFSGK